MIFCMVLPALLKLLNHFDLKSIPLSRFVEMPSLKLKLILRVVVLTLVLVAPVYAQTTGYVVAPESEMHVDGTSNQTPEWRVYATQIDGTLSMNEEGRVDSVRLVIPSKMMKSRKSPIMDRGMHGALKANQHAEIVYELVSVSDFTMTGDNTFTLNSTGNLTIADVTNEIAIPIEGIAQENGRVHFTGSHSLLMSEYNLKPPTMMFGAYRTGDELTVTFELIAAPAE